jgi:branched-chain amino acid transport system permease protein
MEGFVLFAVGLLSIGAIYAILCLALNLEAGTDGLWDLGIVSFFGIGAYSYAIVTGLPAGEHQQHMLGFGLPIWLGVAAAGLAGGLIAVLIGLPSLRLRREYFLITTLAFAEVIRQIYANEAWLTNGVAGLYGLRQPFVNLFDPALHQVALCMLLLLCAGVALLVVSRLSRAPFGLTLRALRENELLAETAGINPFHFHMRSYVIAGVIAGIAGATYVWYNTLIIPGQFGPDVTFFVWTAVIIGGIGRNLGAFVGGFILILLYDLLRFIQVSSDLAMVLSSARTVLIGVALIVILRWRPQGIFPERPHRVAIADGG